MGKCLKVTIDGVKGMVCSEIKLPFENGVYTLVGSNGCGKSTILQCIASLISPELGVKSFKKYDVKDEASVELSVDNESMQIFTYDSSKFKWVEKKRYVKINGLYEGSLFYGTRFQDSTRIEDLISKRESLGSDIVDADEEVKNKMSYILHGDETHYRTLKRIRKREIAKKMGLKNLPYFIEVNGGLVSQYRMSSGECLLVSLLHFLYNSIVRRSLPASQDVLVVIDELELALHPIAIGRFMDYLNELTSKHTNLIIYLSSHSPEVIRKMPPRDLFRVDNKGGRISLEQGCYPSYLIRDLSSPVSPDYLLLVEDQLALFFVERVIREEELRNSKLIHCVPVGGWSNVLSLHQELQSKIVLPKTKIISILDGDVRDKNTHETYPTLERIFLPIPNVERFVYDTIVGNKYPRIRRKLKDDIFIVESLESIVERYNKKDGGGKSKEKSFYNHIVECLKKIGSTEEVFVKDLVDLILKEESENCKEFIEELSKKVNKGIGG